MATEIPARPQGWPQPNVKGHEKSDINVKWVFVFVIFLFLSGLAIHFILAWHLDLLAKHPEPSDAWTAARRSARGPVTPPAGTPRLQLSPPADMEAFRAREEAELHSYGWVDKTGGIVRIPIERAMEMVLRPGVLTVREGTNNGPAGPSSLQLQQQRPMQREKGKEK